MTHSRTLHLALVSTSATALCFPAAALACGGLFCNNSHPSCSSRRASCSPSTATRHTCTCASCTPARRRSSAGFCPCPAASRRRSPARASWGRSTPSRRLLHRRVGAQVAVRGAAPADPRVSRASMARAPAPSTAVADSRCSAASPSAPTTGRSWMPAPSRPAHVAPRERLSDPRGHGREAAALRRPGRGVRGHQAAARRGRGRHRAVASELPRHTPTIPIVPTSVAASPDMGLAVHVLGQSRAVPLNYLHVQVNEAAIDWLLYGGQLHAPWSPRRRTRPAGRPSPRTTPGA
jgi:hypothetical protein